MFQEYASTIYPKVPERVLIERTVIVVEVLVFMLRCGPFLIVLTGYPAFLVAYHIIEGPQSRMQWHLRSHGHSM